MEPDTLMDQVQRWSFHRHKNKGAALAATRYRALLRQATRFKLSDDFVRLICHASHEVDQVEEYALMARLPFDVMWVELDMHVKVLEHAAMKSLQDGPPQLDQVAKQGGFLIARDLPSASRWVATEFAATPEVGLWPQPCDVLFDPEGGYAEIVTGSTLWREKMLSRIPGLASIPARIANTDKDFLIPTEWPFFGIMEKQGRDQILGVPEWVSPKIGAIRNSYWINLMKADERKSYLLDARERRGVLRFLVTMLAMINAPPIKIVPGTRQEGGYVAGMARREYFNFSHVTITVPKQRALELVGDYVKHEGAKRRRHKVRGHWRVVEKGKRMLTPCNHRPTLVEEGLGMCLACERLIRWIPWHMRGDASLGFVDQDYVVES